MGFGKRIPHGNDRIASSYYGEWELGTYYSAWRFVMKGQILCGSQDDSDARVLDAAVSRIPLGSLSALRQASELDVRLEFADGLRVDFLATTSGEDECFQISCPDKRLVQFSFARGWEIGRSDRPWVAEKL